MGKNRLRRNDLLSPFHGVRVASPPTNVLERCLAYRPRLKPGQFFSHSSAAILHGLSVPQDLMDDDSVHVAALLPADAPHAVRVHGHRLLEAWTLTEVHGLPVAHQADVVWQLATMLELEDLVIVVDELMNLADVSEEDAKALLLGRITVSRRIGAPKLAGAIDAPRRGARSPAETRRLARDPRDRGRPHHRRAQAARPPGAARSRRSLSPPNRDWSRCTRPGATRIAIRKGATSWGRSAVR